MSNPIKKLAGQTAIYGLSSMVGRFFNYLLTPLWTTFFTSLQFGIITEMYAYVAFLVVFLTYGMETAFFRFSTKEDIRKEDAFTTGLTSLIFSNTLFILLAILFSQSIADWLMYPDHKEYVIWFAIIVGLDAIGAIPLAKLRKENKAIKFAFINIGNVFINILLNLFFLVYCKTNFEAGNTNWIIDTFYNPEIGVGYVFIANLLASIFKFGLLWKETLSISQGAFSFPILKSMIRYASPLLIVGLAGIINETLDRILLKRILIKELSLDNTLIQLGIYGANYKLSMLITMFIQAYRYAAEPFFFNVEKQKDSKNIYISTMNYFVIIVCTMFLFVTCYLDLLKYFINNKELWEGLKVVPILLGANIFLGIYVNQSIWYKLSYKTGYGALISIAGAMITILLNILLIPIIGYVGSAWTTLICYASMVLISYLLGQKYYPINYNLKRIFGYIISALVLYLISEAFISDLSPVVKYSLNSLIILIFVGAAFITEKPRKNLHL